MNNRNYRSHKKEQGLALLEILIAIGILGIIAAGVATLASRTFEEQNANSINKQITDLSLSLKKAFQRSGGYKIVPDSETTLNKLIATSAISIDSVRNPVTNNYYQFIPTKKYSGGGTSNNDAFVLVIDGLSNSLCRKLATGSMFQDATYLEIATGGSSFSNGNFDQAVSASVIKSLQGYANGTSGGGSLNIDDPLTYDALCTNGSNAIFYGSY
jgi:toxin co-regulated pilin